MLEFQTLDSCSTDWRQHAAHCACTLLQEPNSKRMNFNDQQFRSSLSIQAFCHITCTVSAWTSLPAAFKVSCTVHCCVCLPRLAHSAPLRAHVHVCICASRFLDNFFYFFKCMLLPSVIIWTDNVNRPASEDTIAWVHAILCICSYICIPDSMNS